MLDVWSFWRGNGDLRCEDAVEGVKVGLVEDVVQVFEDAPGVVISTA